MTRLAGIVDFGGDKVTLEQLRRIAAPVLAYRPDGQQTWAHQNARFLHLALNSTPESRYEQQPLTTPEHVAIADACIDNDAELIDTLSTVVPAQVAPY